MTLAAVMAQITTDVEALTPAVSASRTFKAIDGRMPRTGASAHRTFYFADVERPGLVFDTGALSVAEWRVNLVMHHNHSGASVQEWADLQYSDANQVARVIEARHSWPSGVYEVLTDGVRFEDLDNGDSQMIVSLRVTVGET